jgi:hypothetical protein
MLEQEENLKQKQEQKIKKALFQIKEREEIQEKKRLKILEGDQKWQAKLDEEKKKKNLRISVS